MDRIKDDFDGWNVAGIRQDNSVALFWTGMETRNVFHGTTADGANGLLFKHAMAAQDHRVSATIGGKLYSDGTFVVRVTDMDNTFAWPNTVSSGIKVSSESYLNVIYPTHQPMANGYQWTYRVTSSSSSSSGDDDGDYVAIMIGVGVGVFVIVLVSVAVGVYWRLGRDKSSQSFEDDKSLVTPINPQE